MNSIDSVYYISVTASDAFYWLTFGAGETYMISTVCANTILNLFLHEYIFEMPELCIIVALFSRQPVYMTQVSCICIFNRHYEDRVIKR